MRGTARDRGMFIYGFVLRSTLAFEMQEANSY